MGVRTFYLNDWMFGGNIFLDDDFTGKNRRIGLGGEAWTNYLKLSANTYLGTTDWHSSRDFDDYNEKPADGPNGSEAAKYDICSD
ncbi:Invasin [compost metagenome]